MFRVRGGVFEEGLDRQSGTATGDEGGETNGKEAFEEVGLVGWFKEGGSGWEEEV